MKILLTAVALVLAGTPSFAYVQAGHLDGGAKAAPAPTSNYQTSPGIGANTPGSDSGPGLGINEPAGEDGLLPVRPVPEPGMMALASMGLLALGVAGRARRRH